jgi:hypothetical protein
MPSEWKIRRDSSMPYQEWSPFPPEAIVQIKNCYGDSRIDQASKFWWGYERNNSEGVITRARRLDRPRGSS